MLEGILELIRFVFSLHPAILIGIGIVGLFLALKVFKFLLQVLMTGVAFGLLPVALVLLGFDVPLTFASILGSMVFGVVFYFIYHSVRTGFRIVRVALSPFTRMFRDKPKKKVIIIEKKHKK